MVKLHHFVTVVSRVVKKKNMTWLENPENERNERLIPHSWFQASVSFFFSNHDGLVLFPLFPPCLFSPTVLAD